MTNKAGKTISFQVKLVAICGPVMNGDGDEYSSEELSFVDGLECDDIFSDYFHDQDLIDIFSGGTMKFFYNSELQKLFVETVYNSKHIPKKDVLKKLSEYTQGQWSDGIGECFEQRDQYHGRDEEYYVSPWYRGQAVKIEVL